MASSSDTARLVPGSVSVSASTPEKSASPASATKLRSCVVCRSRKVRCDKLSPCSNCQRANIPCVVQSNDRPPRWARRLERITNETHGAASQAASNPRTDQVMERLQTLENLVKELSGQLAVANAATKRDASAEAASSLECRKDETSPSSASTSDVQKHFGRMILQDGDRGRYIASGFWSRISDELDGLKMDTRNITGGDESSEDDELPAHSPSTQELSREPLERHAFLFRQGPTSLLSDRQSFDPLPSQIPFLLDVFDENINLLMRIVRMPTLKKLVRPLRGTAPEISLKNQALLFSIYYAAVTSMEDDEVVTNFGSTKAELNLKFRRGFEQALARADFLNNPDIILVQALAIFLALVRRHDSPTYVWMMTGLLIRMAHAVGLHRDGSRFENLSPFEVEQRRRLWWMVITIDIRASEDQGTEFTITKDSFDTRMPLNINDSDVEPDTKETPLERNGVTDMCFALAMFELSRVSRQLVTSSIGFSEQAQLLESLHLKLQDGYFQYSADANDIVHWVGVVCTRLVLSKLTLLVYLPALFASPNDGFSDKVKDKLLIAAIEVAEHNHALNAEMQCRQWRWIYQTYTHWYAIVWLLIEISRRRWTPMVERAWIALHSRWLIPWQHNMAKNQRVWVPLRRLMAKARSHREAQLSYIRSNMTIINQLEQADGHVSLPRSPESLSDTEKQEQFIESWRSLVSKSAAVVTEEQVLETFDVQTTITAPAVYTQNTRSAWPNIRDSSSPHNGRRQSQSVDMQSKYPAPAPQESARVSSTDAGLITWLETGPEQGFQVPEDVDFSMEIDTEIDWNAWLQSATGMELDAGNQSST
ncbi:hypothetical protein F66182_272 [Fusarium sp. NRRL 66182]|nr:hypothetical protein F66182_272 [Fusarium sp. NRRL 66182]